MRGSTRVPGNQQLTDVTAFIQVWLGPVDRSLLLGPMLPLYMTSSIGVLNDTAVLGPFGLVFPAKARAHTVLNCSSIGDEPFVTALQVFRTRAPLSAREVLEFRVECGSAWSAWSTLGPFTTPWATWQLGTAACPRPQLASGLKVTRGYTPGRLWFSGEDHFDFTLLCGDTNSFVQMAGLDSGRNVEEISSRLCPAGSFISKIQVTLRLEPGTCLDPSALLLRSLLASTDPYRRPALLASPLHSLLASTNPHRHPALLTLAAAPTPGVDGSPPSPYAPCPRHCAHSGLRRIPTVAVPHR